MNPNNLANSLHTEREAVCIWKSGCSHCQKRVDLLVSEETCPNGFCCPRCKSRWILRGHITVSASELHAMSDAEFNELVRQDGLQALHILLD
jgi:endogenous inhibitor of DNA gyrase (YacG/DUF329 family)